MFGEKISGICIIKLFVKVCLQSSTSWSLRGFFFFFAHLFILIFKRVTYSFWQLSQSWSPNKLHTHSGTWKVIAQLLNWLGQGTGATLPPSTPGHLCQGHLSPNRLGAAALEPCLQMLKPVKLAQFLWWLLLQWHIYWSGTFSVESVVYCSVKIMYIHVCIKSNAHIIYI